MIICDRCRCKVDNRPRDEIPEDDFTIGYYITVNSDWAKFARPGEHVVCDACMWKDPKYITLYGKHETQ